MRRLVGPRMERFQRILRRVLRRKGDPGTLGIPMLGTFALPSSQAAQLSNDRNLQCFASASG